MNNKPQGLFLKRLILITLIIIWTTHCKTETKQSNNYKNNPVTSQKTEPVKIVIADGGLNARETPSLDGKISFLIPNYSLINDSKEIGDTLEVKDKKGKWTKINFGNKTGYVFGGYLTKVKLLKSQKNIEGSIYFNLYSLPSEQSSDCMSTYMNYGCLIVIYKVADDKVVNAFSNKVAEAWIDKDHIAEAWSIGDAGYGGSGIRSLNIYSKAETDIWMGESSVATDPQGNTDGSETFCLKSNCYDLKKNPDIIGQIKSTRSLKYYGVGEYKEAISGYSVEIPISKDETIIFIPGKNVVVKK